MKKILLIASVAVFSLAVGILVSLGSPFLKQLDSPLPAFSLPDISGKQRYSSEWQGKILIINFWATWCPPCKKEIPNFIALQKQYAEKGLQFIGIAIDDKESVDDYLSFVDINYPMLVGNDDAIALSRKLGNLSDSVPFTVFVNRQGRIINIHQGELSTEQILDIITPLLNSSLSV